MRVDRSMLMLPEIQPAHLQDQALLAASALSGQESSTGSGFEDFTDSLVGLGRAFQVFVGTNLLANLLTLLQECQ